MPTHPSRVLLGPWGAFGDELAGCLAVVHEGEIVLHALAERRHGRVVVRKGSVTDLNVDRDVRRERRIEQIDDVIYGTEKTGWRSAEGSSVVTDIKIHRMCSRRCLLKPGSQGPN